MRPFLDNILRGRPVPPGRLEAIVANYMRFNGVSPITEITRRQAEGLRQRLAAAGVDLPVYVGMRNWHPYLADVLAEMSRAGVRRAIGFVTAAYHSYPSCGQYKENVRDARTALRDQGLPDIDITYVDSWYDHPASSPRWPDHLRTAIDRLELVVARPGPDRFHRSQHPVVRWPRRAAIASNCRPRLGWLPRARPQGLGAGLPEPQRPAAGPVARAGHQRLPEGGAGKGTRGGGHLADRLHLRSHRGAVRPGREGRRAVPGIGLPMARAETVNDDPAFLDMMADVVLRTWNRYKRFPPLPIISRTWSKA